MGASTSDLRSLDWSRSTNPVGPGGYIQLRASRNAALREGGKRMDWHLRAQVVTKVIVTILRLSGRA